MKRIITFVGTAVISAFALTAIPVTTASAEETKILPEPTEAAPLEGTTPQAGAFRLLSTGGSEIKCGDNLNVFIFIFPNRGKEKVLFEKCTSALSTKCTGGGATTTGDIKLELEVNFWLALLMLKPSGTELVGALVFLFPSALAIECVNSTKTVKIEVVVQAKSCFAAQVEAASLNKLISKANAAFTEFSSGETQILEVLPAGATSEIQCLPTIKVNGGSAELVALEGKFSAETFKKGGKTITIELMNP
jgi:hypothetical protein